MRLLKGHDADYTRFEGYAAVKRRFDGTTANDRAVSTVRELAKGPTEDERGRGLAPTQFPSDPASLDSVTLSGTRLIVDFDERIAKDGGLEGDSAGVGIIAALLANAFDVAEVESFELRGEGSCETFARWLEIDECVVRSRAQAQEWQDSTAAPAKMPPPATPRDEPEEYCGTSQPDCVEPE